MAREGVVSRRTATRYIEAAKELGLRLDSEIADDAVRAVAMCVQARPEPEPSDVRQMLEQHRLRIEQWLEHDLTLVRVQELLARDGVSISYTTLRRYAHEDPPIPWTA
jgi:transposase